MKNSALAPRRLAGLDAIRFICAIVVVIGHLELFRHAASKEIFLPWRLLHAFADNAFNGPAAVIAFFVISGLCIHLPNANNLKINGIRLFYVRRFIRLGIPAAISAAILISMNLNLRYPTFGVLWSVVCEAIYYLLYPLLLAIRRRHGWPILIFASTLAATGIWLLNLEGVRSNADYTVAGLLVWVIGLPSWLLGCWVAENHARFPILSEVQMIGVRFLIYLMSVGLSVLKFHGPALLNSNVVLLSFFSLPITAWVALEVSFHACNTPSAILEAAGKWSYSLYLVHSVTPAIFLSLGLGEAVFGLNLPVVAGALLLSYVFYIFVEKPAHSLAVRWGGRGKSHQIKWP